MSPVVHPPKPYAHFRSVSMFLRDIGAKPGEPGSGIGRVADRTSFQQTRVLKDHQLGIMGCSRCAESLGSLMKLRIEALESLWKHLLQFNCLGRCQLHVHDVTITYLFACFLNRMPVRSGQEVRDALHATGNFDHLCLEQVQQVRRQLEVLTRGVLVSNILMLSVLMQAIRLRCKGRRRDRAQTTNRNYYRRNFLVIHFSSREIANQRT